MLTFSQFRQRAERHRCEGTNDHGMTLHRCREFDTRFCIIGNARLWLCRRHDAELTAAMLGAAKRVRKGIEVLR